MAPTTVGLADVAEITLGLIHASCLKIRNASQRQCENIRGDRHGRKSRRTGNESPEFGVGDANANCLLRFCHVSKCQTPDCLHYNAVMQ